MYVFKILKTHDMLSQIKKKEILKIENTKICFFENGPGLKDNQSK